METDMPDLEFTKNTRGMKNSDEEPKHKKGSMQYCNNYRGIVLLNVTYKVFYNCILSKIKETSENIISHYQRGFKL